MFCAASPSNVLLAYVWCHTIDTLPYPNWDVFWYSKRGFSLAIPSRGYNIFLGICPWLRFNSPMRVCRSFLAPLHYVPGRNWCKSVISHTRLSPYVGSKILYLKYRVPCWSVPGVSLKLCFESKRWQSLMLQRRQQSSFWHVRLHRR